MAHHASVSKGEHDSHAVAGVTGERPPVEIDQQRDRDDPRPGQMISLRPTPQLLLIIMAFLLIGILPLILYGLLFGGVPTLTAIEARQQLTAEPLTTILVDTRDPESFARGHVAGSYNLPYQELMQLDAAGELPAALHGKELLLICGAGLRTPLAVRHLLTLPITATHIHGGMQAWIATATRLNAGTPTLVQVVSSEEASLPARQLSLFEQFSTVSATFVIKPVYMLTSLALIILLWRSRAPDLSALRLGLIFFLAGETACVFNTITFFTSGEQSDLFEYLHGLGMVLFLWFAVFALVDGVDRRLIHFSHPRRPCAILPLCRLCIKTRDVSCGIQRIFTLITPVIAVLALIPLSAVLDDTSYNVTLFGLPYNFTHPGIHQFYEIRYLPFIALGLLAIAFLLLIFGNINTVALAKIPFSAGLGALVYSLLMLALYAMYRDNLVWFVFWEEATELLLIAAICTVLWVFRRGLFPEGLSLTILR